MSFVKSLFLEPNNIDPKPSIVFKHVFGEVCTGFSFPEPPVNTSSDMECVAILMALKQTSQRSGAVTRALTIRR